MFRILIHPFAPKYWIRTRDGIAIYGAARGVTWTRAERGTRATEREKEAGGYQHVGVISPRVLDLLTGRGDVSNNQADLDSDLMDVNIMIGAVMRIPYAQAHLSLQAIERVRRLLQARLHSLEAARPQVALHPVQFDPLTNW